MKLLMYFFIFISLISAFAFPFIPNPNQEQPILDCLNEDQLLMCAAAQNPKLCANYLIDLLCKSPPKEDLL